MSIVNYLKESFRISSLIFTSLVLFRLLLQAFPNNFESLQELPILAYLSIAFISGMFHFLLLDNETYSNHQLIFNQFFYLFLIFLQIILGNFLFQWQLSFKNLIFNFLIALIIYTFIKFFLYRQDSQTAKEINQLIQQRNNPQ